jgi:hypothetical protein
MTAPGRDPRPEPEGELTIRGELQSSSVPELLRSLLGSGETGVLTFARGDVVKRLYLHQGRIVHAASTNVDERLGEVLMVQGRITARQYLDASGQVRSGRRLGTILVEMQALDAHELVPALEDQVREIVLDLFSWTSGDYMLAIRDIDLESLAALNISPENLILEGIRRTRSWPRVLHGVGDIEAVLLPATSEAAYRLDLTPEEQDVLSHVNGRSTVEQICQVSYLSHFETCRILWALLVLGVIRRGQAEAAAPPSAAAERAPDLDLEEVVEKFNQMFGRVHAFLKGRDPDEADRFMDLALEDVSRQYAVLFAGVDLRAYGRADFEQMLANVADLPAEERRSLMISGLNELVFAMQLLAHTRCAPEENAVLTGIVKDGLRRLRTS